MRFTWSATKRSIDLRKHGFDFADAPRVFEAVTCTNRDDRFDYAEQRYTTIGLIDGIPVFIAHTETDDEIRIISFRNATHREARTYFSQIEN